MATTGLPTTSSQMDDLSISCMPASASSSFSSLYSSSSSFPLPPPPSASFHPPVDPLPPLSLAPGPLVFIVHSPFSLYSSSIFLSSFFPFCFLLILLPFPLSSFSICVSSSSRRMCWPCIPSRSQRSLYDGVLLLSRYGALS